jgi:hypothetical protein
VTTRNLKIIMFLWGVCGCVAICDGQVSQSDPQTLQAILAELRQIHSELQRQQAQNQTMQILLFQMQTQQAIINRATQRVDDARSKVSEVQEMEKHDAATISRTEDLLREAQDDSEKKRLTGDTEHFKAGLVLLKSQEQDRLTVLQQAEAQLRKAQDTFDTVEDELDKMVKALQRADQPR